MGSSQGIDELTKSQTFKQIQRTQIKLSDRENESDNMNYQK
jgi:hypothetical protein